MLSRKIEFQGARRMIAVMAASVALACGSMLAAEENARSSNGDLERFISITRELEKAPLDQSLRADRAWAMQWLREAPDISVRACVTPLGGMSLATYSYASEIIAQYVFSMGVFIIEHPAAANDPNAQQEAGVEAALKAYRSILRDNPAAKSAALEALLEAKAKGQLPNVVREAYTICLSNT